MYIDHKDFHTNESERYKAETQARRFVSWLTGEVDGAQRRIVNIETLDEGRTVRVWYWSK